LGRVKGLATANLQYTNLEDTTGLLGNEFAQADVTGTKLPDDIKEFKALEIVKETSQNARKIFFAMLLGCVYSWLTIATTTDVRLLTNTASSPLPIIGTEIPIAWFYIAAPLVLICLYFYFHLYLDNLWKGLAGLPAIFPDGKPLDQTAYPWLINSLVCRHFEKLKKRSKIAHLKEWITIFLAWWVVPITMIGFWLRYLVRHELIGTSIHILLLLFSISFSLIFYQLCKTILQGEEIKPFRFKNLWRDRKSYIVIIVGFILILISISGFTYWGADFREKDVSIKPSDFYKIEDIKKQIESVKGAVLKGRNLSNADMYRAFLVKADLRMVSLRGANLEEADLRGANLQKANLGEAKLQKAFLRGADLQEADLRGADLQEADLYEMMLPIVDAFPRGTKNLTIDQLSKVETLYKAKLDPELLEQVKKCCPHLLEEPK
jgi:hypothetical protein